MDIIHEHVQCNVGSVVTFPAADQHSPLTGVTLPTHTTCTDRFSRRDISCSVSRSEFHR